MGWLTGWSRQSQLALLREGLQHLGVVEDMHWAYRHTNKALIAALLPEYKLNELMIAAGDAVEALERGGSPVVFRKHVLSFYHASVLARMAADQTLAGQTLAARKQSFD